MSYRHEIYFDAAAEAEVPFSREEFATRLTRIREAMAGAGIDCLFLTSPESLYYVSGFRCMWYQTESPQEWPPSNGIAVHVDHDRFIHFETEREAFLTRTFSVAGDVRFFPPDSYRDGTRFVATELAAEGWLNGKVGLEYWAIRPNRAVSERVQAAFESAGATVVDGSKILREVRWLKSPAEMHCLEQAARIAVVGHRAARDTIRAGVTELEVQGEVTRAMSAAGGEPQAMPMPVLSGRKSNATHAVSTRKKIRAGEIVTIDVSGVFERYHVNAGRTYSVGEPNAEVLDVATRSAAAMNVVRECLRPGLPVRELNERVKAYYDQQDLWERRGWIGGYEMGIAFASDWVGNFVYDPLAGKNAERVFEPGTAVNHEIQMFLPQHCGAFFVVETLFFYDQRATLATEDIPYSLIVID